MTLPLISVWSFQTGSWELGTSVSFLAFLSTYSQTLFAFSKYRFSLHCALRSLIPRALSCRLPGVFAWTLTVKQKLPQCRESCCSRSTNILLQQKEHNSFHLSPCNLKWFPSCPSPSWRKHCTTLFIPKAGKSHNNKFSVPWVCFQRLSLIHFVRSWLPMLICSVSASPTCQCFCRSLRAI